MLGRLDGFALLFLTVILTITRVAYAQWHDYEESDPPPPPNSYGGSRTGNYRPMGQIRLGNSDQEDEIALALSNMGAISTSIKESLKPLMGSPTNMPNRFPSPSIDRYNSLTPTNGGHSLSYKPEGRYNPSEDGYGMNYNRPPPPQSQSMGTSPNMAWNNMDSDGNFTPPPEDVATSYPARRAGAPTQPSTRPSYEGGYSQSPNPYGDKDGNDKIGYGKPVSSGALIRLGKYDNDDEVTNALLGLFAGIDDGPDHIGPPQFKPLQSIEKPLNPSSYDGPQRPKPLAVPPQRPSVYSKPNAPESANPLPTEGTGWFKIGPGGQFVPSSVGEGFKGTFSQIPAPGSSGNTGSGGRNRQGMSGGLGLGPTTKGGKQVGTSSGPQRRIIDGQEYTVEEWVLTPREQLEMNAEPQGNLQMLGKFSTDPTPASQLDTYQGATKNIDLYSFYESAYKDKWNDPMWNLQWYMHDYRTKDGPVMDMNVVPAWDMGYTGKNVKIVVVDDGVMHGHPDLAPNHLVDMSYDFDLNKKGSQPIEPLSENSHGTKCASQIGMVAGNGLCGVGMAYDAKIAGVRSAVGKKTTAYQASLSLTYRLEDMDISSNSYGPKDDGKVMERAPHLYYEGMLEGVTKGRGGNGLVYVFPSGNGRLEGDHCGADAYMNTRYTIGVSSATQHGKVADYSERCAAVMAAVYSSGGSRDERVVTVEMANNCNDTFGGTSAAVPHGTAVIALMLQANPNLTYRDVMHIITMGTEVAPLANNENTWRRNGAGFWVSHDFGFGLLNAKNLVLLAEKWRNVPVEHNSCVVEFPIRQSVNLGTGRTAIVEVYADGCPSQQSVTWIENIEIEITVKYAYRGALSITLTSPSGTVSDLLETRLPDNANGMRDWIFRSVQHWGENPTGNWELRVTCNALKGLPALSGSIEKAILSFHGMAGNPPHQKDLPRTYAAFRLPDNRSSRDRMPTRQFG